MPLSEMGLHSFHSDFQSLKRKKPSPDGAFHREIKDLDLFPSPFSFGSKYIDNSDNGKLPKRELKYLKIFIENNII